MKSIKIKQTATDHSEKSVEFYFNTISKMTPVSPEEESILVQRIHKGDKEAMDRLVCGNLRFVISVAKQFQNQGVPLADLIEEGNLGLIKAAERFDEKKDNKFISYAVWWIMEAIQHAVRNTGRHIRFPRRMLDIMKSVQDFQKRYEAETGNTASVEDIANELDIDEKTINEVLNTDVRGRSLDSYMTEDGELTLGDTLSQDFFFSPDYDTETYSAGECIDKALHGVLKDRDIYVMRQYYGLDGEAKSAQEIGQELNLSRERIRQILNESIRKLRNSRYKQELRMCC